MKKLLLIFTMFTLFGCTQKDSVEPLKEQGEQTNEPVQSSTEDSISEVEYVIEIEGKNIYELGTHVEIPHASCNHVECSVLINESEVDFSIPGIYTIYYSGIVNGEEVVTETTTIKIIDSIHPEVYLNGNNVVTVELYGAYNELGVDIIDASNDVTTEIVSDVDVTKEGKYEVIYTVTDSSGNQSSITRLVEVVMVKDEFYDDSNRDWENTSLDYIINREPDLKERGYYKLVYLPADPAKGFNFPYVIELPDPINREANVDYRKYPLVSVNNLNRFDGGYNSNWEAQLRDQLINEIPGKYAYEMSLAEDMYIPEITILVPQPCWGEVGMNDTPWGGNMWFRNLNEHAVALKEIHLSGGLLTGVNGCSSNSDFNPEDLYDVDLQIYNILEDAYQRLTDAGWEIEEQNFLYGFSNTGEFTQGFSFIYPEKVKAYYSGGSFETPIPSETDLSIDLIFPYGLSDYTELFGKNFNLEAWNNVAKYQDLGIRDYEGGSATDEARGVYTYLLNELYEGDVEDKFTMTKNNILKLLKYGGEGMFVVNISKAHSITPNDAEKVLEFFKMNRQFETPVYFETDIVEEYIIISTDDLTPSSLNLFWNEAVNYVDEFVPTQSVKEDDEQNGNEGTTGFIYGGVPESDLLREKYNFESTWNANRLDQEMYDQLSNIYIILDSNADGFRFDAIPEIETMEPNQVLSFMNQDNKRIVIINPSSDSMIIDIINAAPDDLLTNDYEYIHT